MGRCSSSILRQRLQFVLVDETAFYRLSTILIKRKIDFVADKVSSNRHRRYIRGRKGVQDECGRCEGKSLSILAGRWTNISAFRHLWKPKNGCEFTYLDSLSIWASLASSFDVAIGERLRATTCLWVSSLTQNGDLYLRDLEQESGLLISSPVPSVWSASFSVEYANSFWWFPHQWRHTKPHKWNYTQLESFMTLNKEFAEVSMVFSLLHPSLFSFSITILEESGKFWWFPHSWAHSQAHPQNASEITDDMMRNKYYSEVKRTPEWQGMLQKRLRILRWRRLDSAPVLCWSELLTDREDAWAWFRFWSSITFVI